MKKRRTILNLLGIFSALTLVVSVTFTYAAYVNSEKYGQSYNINLSFSDKFNGGNGTTDSPYLINNAQQLRNLALLTNMGCFDEPTSFKLTSSFDWATETIDLVPIGTMHTPFNGVFDGNGNYIKNLKVTGKETADTGMFGYVGRSGVIKNLILDNPIVTNTSDTKLNYDNAQNNIDKNPLRLYYDNNKMTTQISVQPCNSNFTVLTDQTAINSGTMYFKITLPELPTKGWTKNNLKVLDITDYELTSSEPYVSWVLESGKTNVFNVTFTKPTATEAEHMTPVVTAKLRALVTDTSTNETNVCSYVVENFKFHFDGKNIVSNPVSPYCFDRLFYPTLKKDRDDGTNLYINDARHLIHNGIICGSLDGTADHILVYKGTLITHNRPYNSNSILIGRYIDDYSSGIVSREISDLNSVYKDNNGQNLLKDISKYLVENNSVLNADYNSGNRYLKDIYASGGNVEGRLSPKMEDVVRFYDRNNYDDKKSPNSLKLVTRVVDNKPMKMIALTDDIEAGLFKPPGSFLEPTARPEGWYTMAVSNAIQFWATGNHVDESFWQKLFSPSSLENLVINISIDYLFFDKEPNINPDQDSEVKFKVLLTKKQYKDNGVLGSTWYDQKDTYFSRTTSGPEVYSENTMWNRGGFRYKPRVLDDFHYYALNDVTSSGTYFAKNQPNAPLDQRVYVKPEEDGSDPLIFKGGEYEAGIPNSDDNYTLRTKTFSIILDNSYLKDLGILGGIRGANKRTPLVLLGLYSPNIPNGDYIPPYDTNGNAQTEKARQPRLNYELDIAKIDITLSNKAGNLNTKIATVDVGEGNALPTRNAPKYTESTDKWANWPSDSLSKPMVELFNYEYSLPAGSQIPETNTITVKGGVPTDTSIVISRNDKVNVLYQFDALTGELTQFIRDYNGFEGKTIITNQNG